MLIRRAGSGPATVRARAVAALAGFSLVVLPMLLVAGLREPPEDHRQTAAYATVVQEVSMSAGSILEIELKPGITDLREQAYDRDTLRGFSDRWASDLADLRARLDATDVPAGFARAHEGYLDALDGYRQVALILSRAADAEVGVARERIITEAIALGRRADDTWDRAQDVLAERLRQHGLDPTRWLPVGD